MSKKIYQILVFVTLGILILTCIPNIIYYNAVAYGPHNKLVDQNFAVIMLWVNAAILALSTITIIAIVIKYFLDSKKVKNNSHKKINYLQKDDMQEDM